MKTYQGTGICGYCEMEGRVYEYDISCRNQLQGDKWAMHDYPELTDDGLPHKFTDNLESVTASVGRDQGLLNLKQTPQQHESVLLSYSEETRLLEEQSFLKHSYSRLLLFLSTLSTHNSHD
jgi:hypothetical protein